MFEKIKNLYRGIKGDIEINKINKASNLIMFGVGSILFNEFIEEMDFDKAQVLAAQVVNYLRGYDINRIIVESEEPLKSQIVAIKDMVRDRAIKAMDNDFDLRVMVIQNLSTHQILGILGIENFTPSEIDQVDFLLNKYGQDVPSLGTDYDKLLTLADNFYQSRVHGK